MVQRRLYSVSDLAVELTRDRRTVGDALRNIAPDGEIKGRPAWFMTTAISALYGERTGARERKLLAEAGLAELALAQKRGELASVHVLAEVWTVNAWSFANAYSPSPESFRASSSLRRSTLLRTNSMKPSNSYPREPISSQASWVKACLMRGRTTWKPPPRLNLIEWADTTGTWRLKRRRPLDGGEQQRSRSRSVRCTPSLNGTPTRSQ